MKFQIIVPADAKISRFAALKLTNYLQQVTAQSAPIIGDALKPDKDSDLIVIGNEKRNRLTRQSGFKHDWSGMRPDGYVIRTLRWNKKKLIVVAGKTECGDKYAVYRLIKELEVRGNLIVPGNYNILMNPFVKVREVIMGNAVPWDPFAYADEIPKNERGFSWDVFFKTYPLSLNFPDNAEARKRKKCALWKILGKYCLENWERDKTLRYMEQMDFYGFNSVEFFDESESYLHSGCFVTRRQWREKLLTMMDRTRVIGNRISLGIWGGHAFVMNGGQIAADWDSPLCNDRLKFPSDGKRYWKQVSPCWNDPQERKKIQTHLNYLSGYAPYIDHILSFFNDPGGCNKNGCTVATCMEIMNYEYHIFRAKNSKIDATYNLWPLTSNAFGYRMIDTLQRTPCWNGTYTWIDFRGAIQRLDPGIMIANRKYQPELAAYCRKWKRKYGLWSWYNSDQEITASLHVEAERLEREFCELPNEASNCLEYYAVPCNCHSLNSAGIYVAASLLWEPHRRAFDILREFCELVFGPRIAGNVFHGYEAVARIRNHDVDGDSAFYTGYLGAGTDRPDEDAEMAEVALGGLQKTSLDKTWISKIPLAVDRAELLEDLKDHVRLIWQYAEFRKVHAFLARKPRIMSSDIRKLPRVDKLRKSGGMIEWRKAEETRRLLVGKENYKIGKRR